METDLSAAPRAAACPSCGAALRPDASWCSLCYHDLRPAPAPEPVPQVAPSTPSYGGHDPLTAPLLDLVLPPVPAQAAAPVAVPQAPVDAPPAPSGSGAEPQWPCTRCGASNGLTQPVCAVCGARFLDAAAEKPTLVVPGIGDITRYSRGQRAAIAGGIAAAVLVPFAVFTFVLTPPPTPPPASGSTPVTSQTTQTAP